MGSAGSKPLGPGNAGSSTAFMLINVGGLAYGFDREITSSTVSMASDMLIVIRENPLKIVAKSRFCGFVEMKLTTSSKGNNCA